MTPQELKNSILQRAIQGKLVEQRAEEGTAEELYQQIQQEKQRLIKEKKIKKEKPLPEIAEDEVPFDIPESWKWVRWGELSESIQYGYNASAQEKGDIRMVRISDIQDNRVIWDSVPFCSIDDDDIPTYLLEENDILFARTGGTVGKSFLVQNVPVKAIYAGYLIRTRYSNRLSPKYMKFFMESSLYWTQLKNGTIATAQPNCNGKTLSKMILPLPPLAEQYRIVAKIEELMPLVDRYEKAWGRLEDFNKRFPVDMQKSILQTAIQGKLVEQRKEEGTGEELYQQIQAEKQQLIKEKKIKKGKPLPEIAEDEVPFDVPESWKWIRLGELTEIITSGSRDWAKYYSDKGDIFLRMGNLSRNSFQLRLDKIQRVSLPNSAEGQRTSLQEGDLLFSITGEVGMLGLIPKNFGTAYINQHTAMIRFIATLRNRYIPYLLMTDYAQKFYNGNQHGIKNSFRLDTIALLPVPFPPLAEQKRIVAKLEVVLPLCERLK